MFKSLFSKATETYEQKHLLCTNAPKGFVRKATLRLFSKSYLHHNNYYVILYPEKVPKQDENLRF